MSDIQGKIEINKKIRNRNYIKKFLYFFLSLSILLLWLCFIFQMSAKPGEESAGLSLRIARLAYKAPVIEMIFSFDTFHLIIRKAAHFTEYGILAVLFMNFIYACKNVKRKGIDDNKNIHNKDADSISYGSKVKIFFLIDIAFCCIYASLDEYHQSFVSGRGPSIRDVLIDTAGAVVFLSVLALILCIRNTKKLKKN